MVPGKRLALYGFCTPPRRARTNPACMPGMHHDNSSIYSTIDNPAAKDNTAAKDMSRTSRTIPSWQKFFCQEEAPLRIDPANGASKGM